MADIEGEARRGRITIDELIALNEEIAALVRAGVPLETGLVGFGSDVKGRLGRLAEALGGRLERGQSLPEALEAEGDRVPPLYRTVVEAGLRSGRLATALESLTGFARGVADLRRLIGLALIYPAFVFLVAYGLFVALVVVVGPPMIEAFTSIAETRPRFADGIETLANTAVYWGPIGPILVVLGVATWVRSGHRLFRGSGGLSAWIGALPMVRPMLQNARTALFAELLATLLEHDVPLPEALSLSAQAIGNPRLIQTAERAADAVQRGERLRDALPAKDRTTLPPMLRWLIVTGQEQGGTVEALRLAASRYRQRAIEQAEMARVLIPAQILLVIGGTSALLFGLGLFLPLTEFLHVLAR